jgi:hypothetical protein
MTNRMVAVVQLAVAAAAAVGCVLSWFAARSLEVVAPILDGEPAKSSLVYDPPWIGLAVLLAAIAGVVAVSGVARLRRG